MELGIKGRAALIAGASDGMGEGIALAFAKEGVDLALCARSTDKLEKVAAAARALGVRVLARSVDVADGAQVEAFAAAAQQELGRIDIFVNTIGGSTKPGPLLEVEAEYFASSYDLNVLSGVRFMRALMPAMQQRRWGRVVLFSSIAGQQVSPAPVNRFVEYGVSKTALVALTKYASEHVAADGVTVNCLCPGPIATRNSWANPNLPKDVLEQRRAMIPMQRLGTVEEIADLTLFLASERSGFITGVSVPIDGGQSRHI